MSVREIEVESVSSNDRDVAESYVIGDAIVAEYFFTCPLIYTRSAWTTAAKLGRSELRLGFVGPFYRNLSVRFFDNLCGFDSYIPS